MFDFDANLSAAVARTNSLPSPARAQPHAVAFIDA
jgi:hypothetical protein